MPDEMLVLGTLTKACSRKRSQGLREPAVGNLCGRAASRAMSNARRELFVREGKRRDRMDNGGAQCKGAALWSSKGEEGKDRWQSTRYVT